MCVCGVSSHWLDCICGVHSGAVASPGVNVDPFKLAAELDSDSTEGQCIV
uniref:Uncharacterized protein n=1 Tax=Anguilla anguilla TaxID=7936 RepID=A0A0E9VQD2_ANGAN